MLLARAPDSVACGVSLSCSLRIEGGGMDCLYDCFSFGVLVAPGIPLASDPLGMPWEIMALKGNVGGAVRP